MSLPPRSIVIRQDDFLSRSVEESPRLTLGLIGGGIGALWGGMFGAMFGAKMTGALIGGVILGVRGARRGKELQAWLPK